MKKQLMICMISFLTLGAMAVVPSTEDPNKYCAVNKDGVRSILYQGHVITEEVTLTNGTKIKPDGTITRVNGAIQILNDGECMDKDGVVSKEPVNTENNYEPHHK